MATPNNLLFTLDGIDYKYTVERQLLGSNQSIDLYHNTPNDKNNVSLGNAYIDHNVEQITVDIFLNEDIVALPYFELGDDPEKVAMNMATIL